MSLLVIYTGGTLGMRAGPNGLAPVPAWLSQRLIRLYPELTMIEYAPLLDSSAMGPADWNRIGADIAARADEFDGFVVLHGTDTLAWTASALAFILQGLAKPVVLTGAMHPWEAERSDAPANVAAALALAADGRIREVVVVFDGYAYRGCRVRKVDCEAVAAFASPNAPPLGYFVDDSWRIGNEPRSTVAVASFQPQWLAESARIAHVVLAPGYTLDYLADALDRAALDGLLLQSFGAGNLPISPVLHTVLARMAQAHPVVNVSLCPRGRITPGQYAAGLALRQIGVFDGADMTPEAALVKLYWLASRAVDLAEQRRLFVLSLVGERTGDSVS